MTAKSESAFTELLDVLKILRDILRDQRINITAFLWALGLMLVANHFFWVAAIFYWLSLSSALHGEAYDQFATEMFHICVVAAALAVACLYVAFRDRILSKLLPNRQL